MAFSNLVGVGCGGVNGCVCVGLGLGCMIIGDAMNLFSRFQLEIPIFKIPVFEDNI